MLVPICAGHDRETEGVVRCQSRGSLKGEAMRKGLLRRRQSCLKIDLFSSDGVLEIQKLGMQEISSIAREAGEIFKRLAG